MSKNVRAFIGAFLLLAFGCVAVAAAADQETSLTGTWNVTTQLPIGPGNPSFDIAQSGNTLTGTYRGALGEAPISGTVEGKSFKWTFTASGVECEYVGTLAGNEISGTLNLKGLGEGTFTGTRAK